LEQQSSTDPYLYLIGPDGAVLAEDDDGGDAPERAHPGAQRFLPAPRKRRLHD
jgi:hypothetical protein